MMTMMHTMRTRKGQKRVSKIKEIMGMLVPETECALKQSGKIT